MTIRILLVDDHEMVRRGLALMLQAFDDFEMVGEAANGDQAVEFCVQTQPDVVLMDLVMPGTNGTQATHLIRQRCPRTQVLALTSFSEQERVQEALKAGAIGYLLKDTGIDELALAIRQACAGKASLSPEAASALISIATHPAPGHNLTGREREVLALLVEGLSNPQIAARLQVGESTIKSHVAHLLHKLGAATRAEAVMLAIKHHLVEIPDHPPISG